MSSSGVEKARHRVRPYRADDRAAIRRICCETGFLGRPIDHVFEDRELFADFLTEYYLRHEPEFALVVEIDQQVAGYIIASCRPRLHQLFSVYQGLSLLLRVFLRFFRYTSASRDYLRWIITRSLREVPAAPRSVGHFHINLLPAARRIAVTRDLIEQFLQTLHRRNVAKISAQMVTFADRRGIALLERYGFVELNRSEITKFRKYTSEKVYLSTIHKDLTDHRGRFLYPVRERR